MDGEAGASERSQAFIIGLDAYLKVLAVMTSNYNHEVNGWRLPQCVSALGPMFSTFIIDFMGGKASEPNKINGP